MTGITNFASPPWSSLVEVERAAFCSFGGPPTRVPIKYFFSISLAFCECPMSSKAVVASAPRQKKNRPYQAIPNKQAGKVSDTHRQLLT